MEIIYQASAIDVWPPGFNPRTQGRIPKSCLLTSTPVLFHWCRTDRRGKSIIHGVSYVVSEEVDQPIAGQDRARWEHQTKDIVKKKGGVRGSPARHRVETGGAR